MKKIVLLMVLAAASMFAMMALGQGPASVPAPEATALERFAAFLYNPLTLAVVSIIIMFVPVVRATISNYAIPFITTLIAWLSGLISPSGAKLGAWLIPNDPTGSTHALLTALGSLTPEAHAAGATIGVVGLFGIGLGGFFGGLGGAVLQSAQAYLMQRMFAWPGKILPALPKDSK